MAFHLGAFGEDQDPAAAFVNIAALADDRLFTQGDDLRVPELNQVIIMAGGADNAVASRIRLDSPTLDAFVRPEISPLNAATGDVEPDSPHRLVKMLNSPMILGVDELLNVNLLSNPGAVAFQWALLWFADGAQAPISGGNIHTVRWTSAATVTARVWSSVNPVLDENLPPGEYAVVGLRAESATMIAARFVFRTGELWRPGAMGCDLAADLVDDVFRGGSLGEWGRFPFTQIPAIEVLAGSGDSAFIFHVDLMRVG
jgi:hypothetical protein